MSDLRPEYFRRADESPDETFYAQPRLVTHIDAAAVAVTELYRELFAPGAALLDLMSSWMSHLPDEVAYGRVTGPGAPFAVTFSNRCFPTKAVAAWQALDDAGHAALVRRYFADAGGWGEVRVGRGAGGAAPRRRGRPAVRCGRIPRITGRACPRRGGPREGDRRTGHTEHRGGPATRQARAPAGTTRPRERSYA